MASARRWATSSMSSRRTTAKVEAVNPCLREFRAERDLPSGERGPVEWAALARLAASCLWDTALLVGGAAVLRFEVYDGGGGGAEIGNGAREGWGVREEVGQEVGGERDKVLEV